MQPKIIQLKSRDREVLGQVARHVSADSLGLGAVNRCSELFELASEFERQYLNIKESDPVHDPRLLHKWNRAIKGLCVAYTERDPQLATDPFLKAYVRLRTAWSVVNNEQATIPSRDPVSLDDLSGLAVLMTRDEDVERAFLRSVLGEALTTVVDGLGDGGERLAQIEMRAVLAALHSYS